MVPSRAQICSVLTPEVQPQQLNQGKQPLPLHVPLIPKQTRTSLQRVNSWRLEYNPHQPFHLEVLQTIILDLKGRSSMQTDMSKPHQPCASAGHSHPQLSQNYHPAWCKQDNCWKQSLPACGRGTADATQRQSSAFRVWCSFTCCFALCWKHTRYLKWKYIPLASP